MGAAPMCPTGTWPQGGGFTLSPFLPFPPPREWGAASSPYVIYFSSLWEYFLRELFAHRWCNGPKGSWGQKPRLVSSSWCVGHHLAPALLWCPPMRHLSPHRVSQIPPAHCEWHNVDRLMCALAHCGMQGPVAAASAG